MTDRERWNNKYKKRPLESFKSGPSLWLLKHEEELRSLTGGRALDVAAGFGRNSFYLEQLGYTVDAVDVSDLAMDWLDAEAQKQQLKILAHQLDLAHQNFPQTQYEVIICFNFLFRELFEPMKKALAPGGILVYETVYQDDIEILGSKMNPAYVLDRNELREAFDELKVLDYREEIIELPSGRQKALASILAKKR